MNKTRNGKMLKGATKALVLAVAVCVVLLIGILLPATAAETSGINGYMYQTQAEGKVVWEVSFATKANANQKLAVYSVLEGRLRLEQLLDVEEGADSVFVAFAAEQTEKQYYATLTELDEQALREYDDLQVPFAEGQEITIDVSGKLMQKESNDVENIVSSAVVTEVMDSHVTQSVSESDNANSIASESMEVSVTSISEIPETDEQLEAAQEDSHSTVEADVEPAEESQKLLSLYPLTIAAAEPVARAVVPVALGEINPAGYGAWQMTLPEDKLVALPGDEVLLTFTPVVEGVVFNTEVEGALSANVEYQGTNWDGGIVFRYKVTQEFELLEGRLPISISLCNAEGNMITYNQLDAGIGNIPVLRYYFETETEAGLMDRRVDLHEGERFTIQLVTNIAPERVTLVKVHKKEMEVPFASQSMTYAPDGEENFEDNTNVTIHMEIDEQQRITQRDAAKRMRYVAPIRPENMSLHVTGLDGAELSQGDGKAYYLRKNTGFTITFKSNNWYPLYQESGKALVLTVSDEEGNQLEGPLIRQLAKEGDKYVYTYQAPTGAEFASWLGDKDSIALTFDVRTKDNDNKSVPNAPNVKILNDLVLKSYHIASSADSTGVNQEIRAVVDGENLVVTVKYNNEVSLDNVAFVTQQGEVIAEATISTSTVRPQLGQAVAYPQDQDNVWVMHYRLPASSAAVEGPFWKDNEIVAVRWQATDYAMGTLENDSNSILQNQPGIVGGDVRVYYFAPIVEVAEITPSAVRGPRENAWGPGVEEPSVLAVKNGDKLEIKIKTTHPVAIKKVYRLWNQDEDNKKEVKEYSTAFAVNNDTGEYLVTIGYELSDEPKADLSLLSLHVVLDDGYTPLRTVYLDKSGVLTNELLPLQYYAPVHIKDVAVLSSNAKNSAVSKEGDVITVQFVASHPVHDVDASGQLVCTDNTKVKNVPYEFTFVLSSDSYADKTNVSFVINLADVAENQTSISNADAAQTILFYRPIEATATIASNNNNVMYAKNGDAITLAFTANHEVVVVESSIQSRAGSTGGDYTEKPETTYTIPLFENVMPEDDVTFTTLLEDPAGNILTLSETQDGSKVIYDRTAPVVAITPLMSGFSNKDISFSVVYTDKYLNPSTLTYVKNSEKIHVSSRTDPMETFSQRIALSKEGAYALSAEARDMAGNEAKLSGSIHITIDKTSPKVELKLDKSTFKSGFTLNQIFTVTEDNLRNFICTISNSSGVHEWGLESPMTVEGRHTVYLVAEDQAGNTSVPVTCDVYIDGTAPQPQIKAPSMVDLLQPDTTNAVMGREAKLDINLATLHIGDESPDSFVTLKMLNKRGELLHDFLQNGADAAGTFSFELEKYGDYILVLEAVDGVGNSTGELRYEITYRNYTVGEILSGDIAGASSNVLARVASYRPTLFLVPIAVVAIIILGFIALIRRKDLLEDF